MKPKEIVKVTKDCKEPLVIVIKVTKENIRNGKRDSISFCPVARAFSRERFFKTEVSSEKIRADGETFSISDKIKDWIAKYDRGEKVEPFTIYLNLDERDAFTKEESY